jgi:hypothetical protein
MNIMSQPASFTLLDWAQTKPDDFDLESVYDEQIAPLVDQIRSICDKEGIVSSMLFVIGNQGAVSHTARSFIVPRLDRLSPQILAAEILTGESKPAEARNLAILTAQRAETFFFKEEEQDGQIEKGQV